MKISEGKWSSPYKIDTMNVQLNVRAIAFDTLARRLSYIAAVERVYVLWLLILDWFFN